MNFTAADRLALVIDDDHAFRAACQVLMAGMGVRCRSHPGLPRDEVLRQAFCVIVELDLARITGFDVIAKLAQRCPQMPLLLVSNRGADLLRAATEYARGLGLTDISALAKPVHAARLQAWLESRKARPRLAHESNVRRPPPKLSPPEVVELFENGALRVQYQPQFSLEHGTLFGLEALVRLQHPDHGLLSPASFLSALLATKLDVALFAHLVADAGTMLRRLRPRFGSQFKISINLSRRLLAAEAGPFLNLLSNCHIPPERLTLEVPESIVGRDGKALARTLARVRLMGFELALDDFGTSHSNFDRVTALPISEVKIDRMFLDQAAAGTLGSDMLMHIQRMCKALGLRTVMEGIQSPTRLAWAMRARIDVGQGHWLAPPLPSVELVETLRATCDDVAVCLARTRRTARDERAQSGSALQDASPALELQSGIEAIMAGDEHDPSFAY